MSFLDEFYALCSKHDVQTFALVGKDAQGEPIVSHRAWRVEDDVREQRTSAALTHMELCGLADAILHEQWVPKEDPNAIPDPRAIFEADAEPAPEPPGRPDGPGGSGWETPDDEDPSDEPFIPN